MALQRYKSALFLLLGALCSGLVVVPFARAASSYQRCPSNTTCTVGEYLYDDSYVPITTATCTITSRNPDGTVFINAAAMSSAAQNDGWYSYPVNTAGKADGVYRTQVCCTSGGDYLCLDKTYEVGASFLSTDQVASSVWDSQTSSHSANGTFGANVQTAAPTTSEIWNYSGRTLTGYGSLISDMWNYSGRSLSDFGTLITDIWANATRTLTAGTLGGGINLATIGDLQTATGSAVAAVNGHTDTGLNALSTQVTGLQTSINTINATSDTINALVSGIDTTVTSTNGTVNTINGTVNTINTNLNTIGGNITTIGNNVSTVSGALNTITGSINTANSNINTANGALTTLNGKADTIGNNVSTVSGALNTITGSINTANSNINTANGALTTLNAKADTISSKADSISAQLTAVDGKIDSISTNIGTLLTNWSGSSAGDILTALTTLQGNIGSTSDGCASTTIYGFTKCTQSKWGTHSAADLLDATNTTASIAASLRSEINYTGKSTTAYEDMQSLLTNLNTVSSDVNTVSTNVNTVSSNLNTVGGNVTDLQTQVSTVDTKLNTLTTNVSTLSTTVGSMNTNVSTILTKWSTYTMTDVISGVTDVKTQIGTNSDVCADDTVFGNLDCIEATGGGANDAAILAAATQAADQSTELLNELNYNGKSTTAYADLQALNTNLNTIQTRIGSNIDTASSITLFGNVKKVNETVQSLDTSSAGLTDLLNKWGDYSATDIYDKVKDLSAKIDAVNTVPNVQSILSLSQTNQLDMTSLKNAVLELNAIAQLNKALLENGKYKPIVKLWLEEGSVIFKTLITNPSNSTQVVPIKFYLPKESTEKDIISIDKDLTTAYDPSLDATYVTGQFSLKPHESTIVAIEVTDVWKVSPQETASLRLQAQELTEPLKSTSLFAQGATLKSDVTATLDNIDRVQAEAQTPEARIQAYRQAAPQLQKAKDDIASIKTLIATMSGTGTAVGFLGNVQTLSVWVLIVILIVGIVFMALYIRRLHIKANGIQQIEKPIVKAIVKVIKEPVKLPELPIEPLFHFLPKLSRKMWSYVAIGAGGYILTVMLIAAIFYSYAKQNHLFSSAPQEAAAQEIPKKIILASPKPSPAAETSATDNIFLKTEKQVLGTHTKQK